MPESGAPSASRPFVLPGRSKPLRGLDLCAGAGGCSVGYVRSLGAEMVGVDIEPQPHYPYEFHRADALTYPLEGFDFFHASPPCQDYTTMNNRWGSDAPRLIAPIRARLQATGLPYVIENVPGAKAWLLSPLELTGEMFGLAVHRPRLFESACLLLAPARPPRQKNPAAVYGKQDGRRLWTRKDGTELRVANLEMASIAMGIDWMTWDEIREAIPPAYTEWIGRQLVAYLTAPETPEMAA